jgi:hypothetical protein
MTKSCFVSDCVFSKYLYGPEKGHLSLTAPKSGLSVCCLRALVTVLGFNCSDEHFYICRSASICTRH